MRSTSSLLFLVPAMLMLAACSPDPKPEAADAPASATTPSEPSTDASQVLPEIKALEEACAANDTSSCIELITRYSEGRGVPKDDEKAEALFKKACSGENAERCANIPTLYQEEEAKDGGAVDLLQKACLDNDAKACFDLAVKFGDGNGVDPDEKKASDLFSQACALGYVDACPTPALLGPVE